MTIFQDWIEAVSGEVVKSKQICYQSLQEVIQLSVALFPLYLQPPGKLVYCDMVKEYREQKNGTMALNN